MKIGLWFLYYSLVGCLDLINFLFGGFDSEDMIAIIVPSAVIPPVVYFYLYRRAKRRDAEAKEKGYESYADMVEAEEKAKKADAQAARAAKKAAKDAEKVERATGTKSSGITVDADESDMLLAESSEQDDGATRKTAAGGGVREQRVRLSHHSKHSTLDMKFGEVLYTLESTKKNGRRTVILFYEQVVVLQYEVSFLCYPIMFNQQIIPKYKFKSVAVSKGDPRMAIYAGILAMAVGLYMIPDSTAMGAIILVAGLVSLAIPFFFSTINTVFEVTTVKDEGIARITRQLCSCFFASVPLTLTVVTSEEPDSTFLMEYVYGTLTENMHEMHMTHHLIYDDLARIVKPNKLSDIHEEVGLSDHQVDDEGESDIQLCFQKIKSDKFGKLIHRMESSLDSGFLYNEKTVVSFYEQLAIFQSEKKVLCWPMWFSQEIVPKYKFKAMSTARADNKFMFYVAMFCLLVGIAGCGQDKLALGIVLILVSLPLFYIPYIFCPYDVTFEIATTKDTGIARLLRGMLMGGTTKTFVIRTSEEPDSDKLMGYVYGPLGESMNAIHSLNHLIHDDVSRTLAPTRLSDFSDPHFMN